MFVVVGDGEEGRTSAISYVEAALVFAANPVVLLGSLTNRTLSLLE